MYIFRSSAHDDANTEKVHDDMAARVQPLRYEKDGETTAEREESREAGTEAKGPQYR